MPGTGRWPAVVEGERGPARAQFHHRLRIGRARGAMDRLPEVGELLAGFLRPGVAMGRVVAGCHGVEVLAVQLQALEPQSPTIFVTSAV